MFCTRNHLLGTEQEQDGSRGSTNIVTHGTGLKQPSRAIVGAVSNYYQCPGSLGALIGLDNKAGGLDSGSAVASFHLKPLLSGRRHGSCHGPRPK